MEPPLTSRRVSSRVLEATAASGFPWGEADEWRVVLTLDGEPFLDLRVPDPGPGAGERLAAAVLAGHAHDLAAYRAFVERLRERMGAMPAQDPARPTCSVVVCTHRRPEHIPDLLTTLTSLDPPAHEVIVVDNDPGEHDVRAEVEAAGAVYVREDLRGVDNARNAGVRAASGELVAFTDDDCVPPPGWLRRLAELFYDPQVGAVTGPAFAYELSSPAQQAFEFSGGFSRGLRTRTFDWTSVPPTAAGTAGAGANMIFRRRDLLELGDPFPPELDAGTATATGGDMWALYRMLACGRRVVYDPGTWIQHRHRADAQAMHHTFRGYGLGLAAALTKMLVERGELGALWTSRWLLQQYTEQVRARLAGTADPVQMEIARDYLLGALGGPSAWRAARRAVSAEEAELAQLEVRGPGEEWRSQQRRASAAPTLHGSAGIAVVIPTAGTSGTLAGCLATLALQDTRDFEVVVADDSGGSTAVRDVVAAAGIPVRLVPSDGSGAAAARNTGARATSADHLLFLDDDLMAAPDLVSRHRARHDGSDRVVTGYCRPDPPGRSLVELGAITWWEDHYRLKRAAMAPTFVDTLSGNVSMPRTLFERLGGFDERFGRYRREDWEWGYRALEHGVRMEYDPDAVARHAQRLTVPGRVRAAHAEGRGDALLVQMYPSTATALGPDRPRPSARRFVAGLLLVREDGLTPLGGATLAILESARARRTWLRAFSTAQAAAYYRGRREVGGRRRPRKAIRVEIASPDPVPAPEVVAPAVQLTLEGEPLTTVIPREGHWADTLADELAGGVPWDCWRLATLGGDSPAPPGLDGVEVLFGPARRRHDARHAAALRAAGASVRMASGRRTDHWEALDLLIREAGADVVALPLPGASPSPESVADCVVAFEGERVAGVVAAAARPGERASPLLLHSRRTHPGAYRLVGNQPRMLLVRPAAWREAGGLDAVAARLGPQAPVLDFAEAIQARGGVVGFRDARGLDPRVGASWPRRRREWQRWRAYGGLMARDALARGGAAGAGWYAAKGLGPRSVRLLAPRRHGDTPRHALGVAAAFAWGSLSAARAARRRA